MIGAEWNSALDRPESDRLASGRALQRAVRRRIPAWGGSVVLLLLLAVACAAPRPLAVPEQVLALQEDLPLDQEKRDRIVRFIAAGGQQREGTTAAELLQAVERDFGKFVDRLKDSENLRFVELEQRLSPSTPLGDRTAPVIDAREQYPDEVGRVAYRLHNFWFVFYAQKESPAGDPLSATQWTVKRIVVFRDRPPK
jgi:hypothetical protein